MGLDPVSWVAIAATAAGAGTSAYGQQKAARDTKRAGRRQAAEMRQNAARERERGRRARAQQAARYGASGVYGNMAYQAQTQTIADSLLTQESILQGARNVMKSARNQAKGMMLSSYGTMLQGIGSAAYMGATMGGSAAPTADTSLMPQRQFTGMTDFPSSAI